MLRTFVLLACLAGSAIADPPPTTDRIQQVLRQLDVEHHWLAGKHVDWLTGNPDGKPVCEYGHHTHCSAFVAAVCNHLGIPILEPPQHPQELLADAQYDWLVSAKGRDAGWRLAVDAITANRLATTGHVVLAVYHSPDETQPGHIAIVIASKRSEHEIKVDGPDVSQAGLNNYERTTLRTGFKNHPKAWEAAKEVRFFVFNR